MWLDLLDDLAKNDFQLKKQRIYLTANCWRQHEYEIGFKRLVPLQQDYENYLSQIQDRLQHETGDRRLDGTNLVDTAMGSIDMGILVTKRDEARFRLKQVQLPSNKLEGGAWPGSTEELFVAKGRIAVKEFSLLTTEYRKVGTWTATPLDEEYEEYYDDDDEELKVPEGNS